MSQPPVGAEGQIQEDGRHNAAGDEQRFELSGANVADVGDLLPTVHRGIALAVRVDNPVQ